MSIGALTAAVSGLEAYSTAIQKNASNIAQVSTGTGAEDQGPPSAASQVDLTREITEMLLNERGFEANIKTLQTADTLMQTLLDIRA